MTAPRHDRDGARRKPYSKPRNARRDAVLSERAARALSWQGALGTAERLRLARVLDRHRVRFAAAGDREAAAEMQRLRRDVLDNAGSREAGQAAWEDRRMYLAAHNTEREET